MLTKRNLKSILPGQRLTKTIKPQEHLKPYNLTVVKTYKLRLTKRMIRCISLKFYNLIMSYAREIRPFVASAIILGISISL